eukprot:s849_g10.t1
MFLHVTDTPAEVQFLQEIRGDDRAVDVAWVRQQLDSQLQNVVEIEGNGYAFAARLVDGSVVRFADIWFSDHKPVCFSFLYSQSHVWSFKAVPTRKWTAPPEVPLQTWKNALQIAWSEVAVPSVSNTNQEWNGFCSIAERAHLSALEACGATIPKPRRSRNKGSEFQVEAADARTFRLAQQAAFKELRLRKLLGRIAEAQNQQSRGRQPPAILIRRIFSHPFVVRQGLQNLGEAREWAQQELRSHVQKPKFAASGSGCVRNSL